VHILKQFIKFRINYVILTCALWSNWPAFTNPSTRIGVMKKVCCLFGWNVVELHHIVGTCGVMSPKEHSREVKEVHFEKIWGTLALWDIRKCEVQSVCWKWCCATRLLTTCWSTGNYLQSYHEDSLETGMCVTCIIHPITSKLCFISEQNERRRFRVSIGPPEKL
jgi:hypothetical protein